MHGYVHFGALVDTKEFASQAVEQTDRELMTKACNTILESTAGDPARV